LAREMTRGVHVGASGALFWVFRLWARVARDCGLLHV